MQQKLPNTKALQVFSAVAQEMSVTRAASALHMTQSAVSRQLLGLEALLGVALFRREKQRLYLSVAGSQYLQEVSPLLDQLSQASDRLQQANNRSLKIGIEPALASRWLIPRLADFKMQNPGVDVELLTDIRQLYQQTGDLDVGFLFGDGQFNDARSHYFMAEKLVAVCTPALLKTQAVAKTLEQSLNFPILHHTAAYSTSEAWLLAAGLGQPQIDSLGGSRLGSFGLIVDLAKQGLGMAIVPEYFIKDDLHHGELVLACEECLPSEKAYYLVMPKHSESKPRALLFKNWVLSQSL